MSDLISRQAAIDEVDSETVSTNPDHFKSSEKFIKFMDDADIASFGKWQWANGFNTALVASKIRLEKLPSAQSEQRWIPVSEKLPKVGREVLVCLDFKGARSVYISHFYGDGEFHGLDDEYLTPEGKKYRKAVAWMPLPKPYKAENEEKLSWLGKNCKDCKNEKCKSLGKLPKGYDCALWQAESEE